MLKCVRTATSAAVLTLIAGAMLPGVPWAAAAEVPQIVVSVADTDVSAPALSGDGRYVAFLAIRRGQTSPRQELRRADLAGSGGFELLNPSITGGVARGRYGFPPVISADGSRVAFTSNAARLVQGDTNGRYDAFVRDASTDTTLLSSIAFDGGVANRNSGMTSLSKNGRYAVFTSASTDVVPGSTTTNADVYRRDLTNDTTVQVTVRPNGAPSKGPGSSSTDVSADGNLVAFNSYDADLVKNDGDQQGDLFIRNMSTGTTLLLSPNLPAGADPSGVVISPDGQWVSSRWSDGSLHLTRVSSKVTTTVVTDGYALTGSFSSQLGRFVFMSDGTPYVRDLSTGVTTAINTPATGGSVSNVSISGNGRFAAYDWLPGDGSPSVIYRVAL